MNDIRSEELLATPGIAAVLSSEEKENLQQWHEQRLNAVPESTLMNIFVGFGAWLAAVFLMSFVFAALTVAEETGAIVCGSLLLAASTALLRNSTAAFLRQLGLAFALAGNLLLIGGIVMLVDEFHLELAIILQAIMIAVTFRLIPSAPFRFIMVAGFHAVCMIWCLVEDQQNMLNVLLLTQLLISSAFFHPRLPASLQPALYASVLAMPAEIIFIEFMQQFSFMNDEVAGLQLLPATIFITAALLTVFWQVVHRWQLSRALEISLLLPLILFALLTDIGVLTGLLILFGAYALADRWLGIAAAIVLPVFLFFHYYALDVTLLQKSFVLLGSGVLLLLMRWALTWHARNEQGGVA